MGFLRPSTITIMAGYDSIINLELIRYTMSIHTESQNKLIMTKLFLLSDNEKKKKT